LEIQILAQKPKAIDNLGQREYIEGEEIVSLQYRPVDSHFWAGLMKIKDDFLAGGRFKVRNGGQIRLLEDAWLGDRPFKEMYPNLYRVVRRKDDTVANVLQIVSLNVSFRRGMVNEKLIS
jgi:hypothetical protein